MECATLEDVVIWASSPRYEKFILEFDGETAIKYVSKTDITFIR